MTTENPNIGTSTTKMSVLSWYRDHVVAMPLATAKKHMQSLEIETKQAEGTPNWVEFAAALKLVSDRIDDLLPKVPASVSQHDHSIGDRVKTNWPDYLPKSTMYIHMHLCELLYAWKLNPYRSWVVDANTTMDVTVDEVSEEKGITRFAFPSSRDADAFIEMYGLDDFVVRKDEGVIENAQGNQFKALAVKFTNRFERDQVNDFLQIYNSAIFALSVIHDERRQAVSVDGNRFGFVTADHFTQRETIELMRIRAARENLGFGFKGTNESVAGN